MNSQPKYYNPHISVDCVVFGFNRHGMQALLIDRANNHGDTRKKLPGSLIIRNEMLEKAANRVLIDLTGLKNVFLKQFAVFDNPDRMQKQDDLDWLRESTQMNIDRVITIAYYSLLKIEDSQITSLSKEYNAQWFKLADIPELSFDHNKILNQGLQEVRRELLTEPHCFELLPEKFSLNQLHHLYEEILDITIDNRNFRKKIDRLDYIYPLNEWQKNVSHKPARLYFFDKERFYQTRKTDPGLVI
ncbi:MAG: NUDIX hydrolase [Bacteroidetes bacterium]|jgi:hypothetical protein|nr:NUDIX hydrolase [Bacteroidota bacterium]